jgi:hypothetical protein
VAEVIHSFESAVVFGEIVYVAHLAGRVRGPAWEGWIEFQSEDGDDIRRTHLETTQPDRTALRAWAFHLPASYLEEAFARAVEPLIMRARDETSQAFFEGPAPVSVAAPSNHGASASRLARRRLI